MTTPLETLRQQVEAAPGVWRVHGANEADASLIVSSDAIARALVAEATVEEVARMIDPSSWRVFDGYLADMKRKYKGENAGYDPEAFKDKKSMALALSILNLIAGKAVEPGDEVLA